jgi:hypothetical protein
MTSTEQAAATSANLDQYKAQVRERALRVKRDMGWDTAHMNKTLIALGIEPVHEYKVSVPVTIHTTFDFGTYEVDTPEEAFLRACRDHGVSTPEEFVERAKSGYRVGGNYYLTIAEGTEFGEMATTIVGVPADES